MERNTNKSERMTWQTFFEYGGAGIVDTVVRVRISNSSGSGIKHIVLKDVLAALADNGILPKDTTYASYRTQKWRYTELQKGSIPNSMAMQEIWFKNEIDDEEK